MIRIVFSLILLIHCSSFMRAQTINNVVNREVSISVNQSSLRALIQQIEQQGDVIFSYSGNLISEHIKISKEYKGMSIKNVLNDVLPPDIIYKTSGNNIILYKAPYEIALPVPVKKQTPQIIKEVHDTTFVYVTDTVIDKQIDSVFITRIDTLIKTEIVKDTILIEQKSPFDFSLALYYQLNQGKTTYSHFGTSSTGLGLKKLLETSTTIKTYNQWGINAGIIKNNLSFTTGLGFRTIKEEINKSIVLDYMDSISADTIGLHNVSSITRNYISIPVWVGWNKNLGKHFIVEANLGFGIYILSSANGSFLNIINTVSITPVKQQLNSVVMELSTSIKLQYMLKDKVGVFVSSGFNYQLNSEYISDYPIAKRINSFAYSFGIISRF